jgi:hypothetical protein
MFVPIWPSLGVVWCKLLCFPYRVSNLYLVVPPLHQCIPSCRVLCVLLLTYLLTPWSESASELYRPSNRRVRVVMTAYYYSSEDGMIYYYYCYCEDKMLFTGIGTGFMLWVIFFNLKYISFNRILRMAFMVSFTGLWAVTCNYVSLY